MATLKGSTSGAADGAPGEGGERSLAPSPVDRALVLAAERAHTALLERVRFRLDKACRRVAGRDRLVIVADPGDAYARMVLGCVFGLLPLDTAPILFDTDRSAFVETCATAEPVDPNNSGSAERAADFRRLGAAISFKHQAHPAHVLAVSLTSLCWSVAPLRITHAGDARVEMRPS